jgi:hypothetical protein
MRIQQYEMGDQAVLDTATTSSIMGHYSSTWQLVTSSARQQDLNVHLADSFTLSLVANRLTLFQSVGAWK